MKIRKFGLFLSLIGALGANFTLFPRDFSACPQGADLAAWCQKALNTDEKRLQTELFTLVDVKDEAEWRQLKDELDQTYKEACAESTAEELAHKSLPESLINPIYSVLNNRKIRSLLGIIRLERDPDNMYVKAIRTDGSIVTIACGNKKIQADAATDQFTVLIDPDELLATHATPAEIKATLAHEIIHIIHEDDFNVFCLDKICQKKKKKCKVPKKRFARIKGQWERLQEERADLLSGLVDIDYAQANRNHFERNMPAREHLKLTSTHPTDRERYNYMDNLVKAMEQRRLNPWSFLLLILLIPLGVLGLAIIKNRAKLHKKS